MVVLHFSEIVTADIDFILGRLWERGEEEAVFYGLKDKNELQRLLLGMAKQYGYCLKIEGEPVAAFGAGEVKDGVYSTWFIATERFTEQGIGITRFLRGFIREKVKERPTARLEMVSAVGHPDADRWFNALGFQLEPPRNGVFSKYVYLGRTKEG